MQFLSIAWNQAFLLEFQKSACLIAMSTAFASLAEMNKSGLVVLARVD